MKLPKPKKIKIGDWVRIRKIGIDGMYRIISYEEDGTLIVEQDEDGYKHKMKVSIEEVIK